MSEKINETLIGVFNNLNMIFVSGKENVIRLGGSINAIEKLIIELQQGQDVTKDEK